MNSNNKISIFAEDATESVTEQHSTTLGYYYPDTTWQSLTDRSDGAKVGISYSIIYNTAIRQSTFMSTVLAEILAMRNSKTSDNGYTYMATNGIGTTYTGETDLDTHVVNLSQIFANGKFLNDNEVVTRKIDSKAVTTAKIADYAITSGQLGSILGSAQLTSTVNGITLTLSQTNSIGPLQIALSGNSVTNTERSNIAASTSKIYLTGSDTTSGYNALKVNSGVYQQAGTLYAQNMIANGTNSYVQANSFYATSDKRKKKDICELSFEDENSIKQFVEETEIRRFKYLNSQEENIGIIAQDIENISIGNSKFVSADEEGYLRVKENRIIYVLWEYIKKLNRRINDLENK
ncbi:MAG: tail fiber domain-containing protein [Bacilli bacterium]